MDNDQAKFRRLSVLMPVYNEARTLRTIVRQVLAAPVELEIELVCVDDCSRDDTPSILAELAASDARIKVFRHERNQGKGAAIHTAIRNMTGDIAVIQDADLEYDPRDYPVLLAPILDGKADAVFGSRFASAAQRKVLLYWHTLANRVLTWVTNVLNDINLTDMETCYKAVRADILRQIPLTCKRFGIEPELTTRLAQWDVRLYEVPVSYHGRSAAEGKKIGWKDAVAACWYLVKFRFLDTRFTTHDGYAILRSMKKAKRYNRWLFGLFARYVGPRVLEAGCGIGNFTEMLLHSRRLFCLDYDAFYVEMCRRRFGHLENVTVWQGDLQDARALDPAGPGGVDTVICLNVLEHVADDIGVLKAFARVLSPGGYVVLLVPAHRWLFSRCDEVLGHHRRYRRADLAAAMKEAGLEPVASREVNRLGVWGWLAGKWFGVRRLSSMQVRCFSLLFPLGRLLDLLHLGPGLSIVAIGRTPKDG